MIPTPRNGSFDDHVSESMAVANSAAKMMFDEQVLMESISARARCADRVDVLDKVGGLVLLPDDAHATTEQVAAFYEVPVQTVKSLVFDHRDELSGNGYRVFSGAELAEFVGSFGELANISISSKARSVAVFSRKAILNVGQLLTGSDVAKKVRRYLLTVEETATPAHRSQAYRLIRLQERKDYKNVLDALKLGGAEGGDYAEVQNSLYRSLFGATAAQIRRTRKQIDGVRKRDGSFTAESKKVAKNYLSDSEITLLDNTVLAVTAQLGVAYPNGASPEQMMGVIEAAVGLLVPLSRQTVA